MTKPVDKAHLTDTHDISQTYHPLTPPIPVAEMRTTRVNVVLDHQTDRLQASLQKARRR